jgi:PhoH-like ATPase
MPLPPAPDRLGSNLERATLEALAPNAGVLEPRLAGTQAPRSPKSGRSRGAGKASAAGPSARGEARPPAGMPVSAAPADAAESPAMRAERRIESGDRPVAASVTRSKSPAKSKARDASLRKLFVLDTNVLMHDPTSLFRFEEHDLFIPMTTLEELDSNKKGMSEVARNARQASRFLDQLANASKAGIDEGLPLDALGHEGATGKLFFQTRITRLALPDGLPTGKADNQILAVVGALKEQMPDRAVVLVSKDINMRVKARALGLDAEDYANDKALDDSDVLYTGMLQLPDDFWDRHSKGMESWQQAGATFYRIKGPMVAALMVNQLVFWNASSGGAPLLARVRELRGSTAVLQTLRDYTHPKHAVWGINARNREQNFAFNLLMDPDIDFVTLTGQAGTGKTLMTLAAGLAQVLDERRYNEIIVTRVTVPVGEDIGFLPGTEEEKMGPWMGALDDNLEVLHKHDSAAGEWGRAAANDLIRSRIKIKSLNFMRGRTFLNKYVIIDEAQNLTPKQMKTLITRAGPGTKMICLGNLAQIDTPYLTEGSSGLTYVVDRFKGWQHAGHITLARGERSRLADFASEIL